MDQAPGPQAPGGYWTLMIATVTDVVISTATQAQFDADIERGRKLKGVGTPR